MTVTDLAKTCQVKQNWYLYDKLDEYRRQKSSLVIAK